VPNGTVQPFPQGVSCQQCAAQASGDPLVSFVTGPDGKFKIGNAPVGANIPLVIQLGKWRRQIVIPTVNHCVDNPMVASQTHLPTTQSQGDIPKIAIVTGQADPIECVLPKIGLAPSEFTQPTGSGRVHFYQNNGADDGFGTPAQSALIGDPTKLAQYDIVILDCINHANVQATSDKQNLIGYANAGGRVFASHYSYAWLYDIAPFSSTAQWNADQSDLPDSLTGYIDQGTQKGKDFAQWLVNVKASTTLGQIAVQAVRHDLDGVNAPSQQWMSVDPNLSTTPPPLEYTFDTPVGNKPAAQCGRVLFSDFHVNTGGDGSGSFPTECHGTTMTAQEKVLEFMLFDLSSCIAPGQLPPPTCKPQSCMDQHIECGPAGDGCGNLIQCPPCMLPDTCGGGGMPGICGHTQSCMPLTCAQQHIECGPAGDGCGNLIQCGDCTPPLTCGGGGKPGVCGGIIS
jgi:hypothetical protein